MGYWRMRPALVPLQALIWQVQLGPDQALGRVHQPQRPAYTGHITCCNVRYHTLLCYLTGHR